MRVMLLVLLTAALCGCSSSREVYTSEGSVVYAISCQLQSYESCIEKAGELCGTLGYRFVLADGSPAPAPTPPTASTAPALTPEPAVSAVGAVPDAAAPAPATTPAATPSTPPAGYALQRKYYVRCHS
jgi:hypothetical protein